MVINTGYNLAFNSTLNMIAKLVSQYLESGELRDRFAAFDKTAVEYGKGFEIDVVLAASKYSPSAGERAPEHGAYKSTGFALTFNTVTGGQYPITIDPQRIRECVGDAGKQEAYAAELVESVYQGWTDDKNAAVATEIKKIFAASAKSGATVTLGADVDAWAVDMLTAIKKWTEDLREGVTGTSYGNTVAAAKRIASRDVVVCMSNATAAALDSHGFAKVFTPEYLEANNVSRITSNRFDDNVVVVMDARNVQVRRKYEEMVGPIQNSDGSYNMIYNKHEYIEAAIDGGSGATAGQVAFPFVVISSTEE